MASTGEIPNTWSDLGQNTYMLLVLKSKHGVFTLQLLELLVSDSGTLAMKKLWEFLDRESALKSNTKLGVLCRRMSAEIAEINLLQSPHLETGLSSAIVHVGHSRTHELYTHALHNPQILVDVQEFVRWNPHLLLDDKTPTPTSLRRALRIAFKVDRKALCVVLAAVSLISVRGGIAIGAALGRMDLGIAISSLFAAILSTVEVLLVWLQAC